MKKLFGLIVVLFIGAIWLSGCRPPEVEGVVVNMQQGLYDEAYKLAQEAVKKYPNDPEAWFLLGELHGRREEYKEMNECFEKSLAISPKFKDDIERLRFNYFAENYNSGLKNYYEKARQEQDPQKKKELFKKAAEKFMKAYEAYPGRTEPLTPLAVSFLQLGDTTKAINFIEKVIQNENQNDTLLVKIGDFFFQINELDKAEAIYQKALKINPKNSLAYMSLGELYVKKEQPDKAIEYYQKSMELEPNNVSIPFNIGILMYNEKKYAEAIPFLKKTLEMDPENKDAAEVLSLCYIQKAQKWVEKYNEEEDAAKKSEYRKKFEEIYAEALPFLQDAVKKFPDSALLWNNLGVIYAQLGNKEKAQEAFEMQKKLQGGS